MEKLFGTDGMRGKAGTFPLDAATIEIVGHSLAQHLAESLGRPPSVVIGRDTRESGTWLEAALIAGLSRAGASCKSAGVITTPGVAFLARTLPTDAGIVISASHNIYSDNGIKIFSPSGRKLDEATERLIEADVFDHTDVAANRPISASLETAQTTAHEVEELKSRYVDYLSGDIAGDLSLAGISVVVDCANGAASELAPALLKRLGANISTINNKPDGRNINLNCGSLHMEALQTEVTGRRADLGVAFDGDADRALFVDAKGQIVNGDGTLWVLGRYLQDRNALNDNNVVATVMSNIGLEIAFLSRGIRLVRTAVGDKYVLDELLRLNASIGGEQSGHIIFPRFSLAGDGLITTLTLLRAMTDEKKSLQELLAGFQTLPQILVNVRVKDKRPFDEIPAIREAARRIEDSLGSEGRLLLRYSGTEPLARVMIEGKSQDEIDAQAHQLAEVIRETLGA